MPEQRKLRLNTKQSQRIETIHSVELPASYTDSKHKYSPMNKQTNTTSEVPENENIRIGIRKQQFHFYSTRETAMQARVGIAIKGEDEDVRKNINFYSLNRRSIPTGGMLAVQTTVNHFAESISQQETTE
jgi:hypothetical protein